MKNKNEIKCPAFILTDSQKDKPLGFVKITMRPATRSAHIINTI